MSITPTDVLTTTTTAPPSPDELINAFAHAKAAVDAWTAEVKRLQAGLEAAWNDGNVPTAIDLPGQRLTRRPGRLTKVLAPEPQGQIDAIKAAAIAAGHFTEKTGAPFWELRARKDNDA